jgi:hypothetical protein
LLLIVSSHAFFLPYLLVQRIVSFSALCLAGGTKTVAPLRGSGSNLHVTQHSAFGSGLGYHCSALLHPVTRNTGA